MDANTFEKIVVSNKDLSLLINEQKYSVFMNIKNTDQMTADFIDWISPKYYDAFLAIYERHIEKNPGLICALLRITFLANTETHEKLAELLMPQIDIAIADIIQFHRVVKNRKSDAIVALKRLQEPFNYLTTAILININTPEVLEKKEVFGIRLLEVSEIMRLFTQINSPIEFGIYKQSVEILKKLEIYGEREVHVVRPEKKPNQKAIWYVVGAILIIILILSIS